MSKDTYFLSCAAASIWPVAPVPTRVYIAPPFVEKTERISVFGAREVLKKCAPVMIRLPSVAIAGQTNVFDGQKFPHISPSWEKKEVPGLNRNHVRSQAVLSKISISIAPTRSPVTVFREAAGWKSSVVGGWTK